MKSKRRNEKKAKELCQPRIKVLNRATSFQSHKINKVHLIF